MVSYATAVTLRSSSALVSGLSAARWKYVYTVCPSRMSPYSLATGSFTFTIISARDQTSAAFSTIFAPAAS